MSLRARLLACCLGGRSTKPTVGALDTGGARHSCLPALCPVSSSYWTPDEARGMILFGSAKDRTVPSPRVGSHEQLELALDDLVRLGSMVDDLSIVITGPEQVSIHHRDGTGEAAKVIAYEAVGDAEARRLVGNQARGHTVVVANRISETARGYLGSQRWAWLDRRIGAHIPIGRRDIEIRFTG